MGLPSPFVLQGSRACVFYTRSTDLTMIAGILIFVFVVVFNASWRAVDFPQGFWPRHPWCIEVQAIVGVIPAPQPEFVSHGAPGAGRRGRSARPDQRGRRWSQVHNPKVSPRSVSPRKRRKICDDGKRRKIWQFQRFRVS